MVNPEVFEVFDVTKLHLAQMALSYYFEPDDFLEGLVLGWDERPVMETKKETI